MNTFISVLLLLLFAGTAATIADSLVAPHEKLRLKRAILRLSDSLKKPDPRLVVQAPLFLATRMLRDLYGANPLSFKAFRRSTLFGACLYGFALVFSSLGGNAPFTVDDFPWRTFDRTFAAVETQANNKSLKPEVKALDQKILDRIRRFHNPENRIIYSIAFFPLLIGASALLNFLSIYLARRALEEMAFSRNLLLLFSVVLSTFFLSAMIYPLGFAVICTIATPLSWLVIWALIAAGQYISWILATALLLPAVLVAIFFSSQWIKVLVGVIVLPSLLAIILSVGALVLFPLRRPIRWLLVGFIDRAVSSEKGFLACCGLAFTALGALAAEIAQALSGHIPHF